MAQAVIDSQIKPNYDPPQKCSQGCARWKNLAEDGNSVNQYIADAQWLNGYIPDEAGNQCAQPDGFPQDGPWCWCKNQTDWGYCQAKPPQDSAPQQTFTTNQNDRDIKASVCKSTPNGLNNLNGEINNCTSTIEQKRNTNFAANTLKLQQDISALSATTMDTLVMGDTMFGQFGYNDIAKQLQSRNSDLQTKKDNLLKEVENSEALIERSNRDFSDVRDTVPEPQPKRFVRFIEDYTLAILSISYLFMIIAIIYVYTATADIKLIAFGKSLVGSVLLTMFLFMLLFFLS
jgi:hypothetical protein